MVFFKFINISWKGFEPESAHAANNGLAIARDLLEKIHQKYPEISYGDLWTLAGVCAIQELVRKQYKKEGMCILIT